MTANMSGKALTVVIPAYNEDDRLAKTVDKAVAAAGVELDKYELIIVNDGSTDATGDVAEELARRYPAVSVIHQPENRGVGAAYSAGLERASFPNISLIPGDNAFELSGVKAVFRAVDQADVVVSYRANPQARALPRRLLSVICTTMLRMATGCPIRDGHSLYVWPVERVRRIEVPNDYRYHLITLTSLLQDSGTYLEVPVHLMPKPDANSSVMRVGVVLSLGWAMLRLVLVSLVRPGEAAQQVIWGLESTEDANATNQP